MKTPSTFTSWLIMLLACVALALLIAFSLQRLVPLFSGDEQVDDPVVGQADSDALKDPATTDSESVLERIPRQLSETQTGKADTPEEQANSKAQSGDENQQATSASQSVSEAGSESDSAAQLPDAVSATGDDDSNKQAGDTTSDARTTPQAEDAAPVDDTQKPEEPQRVEPDAELEKTSPPESEERPADNGESNEGESNEVVEDATVEPESEEPEAVETGLVEDTAETVVPKTTTEEDASGAGQSESGKSNSGKSNSDKSPDTDANVEAVDKAGEPQSDNSQLTDEDDVAEVPDAQKTEDTQKTEDPQASEEADPDLPPLELGVIGNEGKITLSGVLPRSRFASVLLQVLRAASSEPIDARPLELLPGDTRSAPWVFDVAKAFGKIDIDYATIELETDGKQVRVDGVVSSVEEKREFENALTSSAELVLTDNSRILVVPTQLAELNVVFQNNRFDSSGFMRVTQQEKVETSFSGRPDGESSIGWDRKVFALEITNSLPAILDIMQESLLSGKLVARSDLDGERIKISGVLLPSPLVDDVSGEQPDQKDRVEKIEQLFGSALPEDLVAEYGLELPLQEEQAIEDALSGDTIAENSGQADAVNPADDSGVSSDEAPATGSKDSQQTNTDPTTTDPTTTDPTTTDPTITEPTNTTSENATATDTTAEVPVGDEKDESGAQSENRSNATEAATNTSGTSAGAADVVELPDDIAQAVASLEEAFSTMSFDYGQVELDADHLSVLDRLFETLFLFPSLKASISVDVFEDRKSVTNLLLSRQRAQAIRDYVIGLGVEAYRLRVAGYGDSKQELGEKSESRVTLNISTIP